MTLETEISKNQASGNGVTTAFSFPYLFLANADLTVIITVDSTGVETTQVITTNYTVVGAGVQAGGTVTMVVAPATGETLTIFRDPSITQGLDLVENDNAPAEQMEEAYDRAAMISQRIDEQLDRTMKFKETSTATAVDFPDPEATKVIAWNAAGTELENVDNESTITMPASSTDNAVTRFSGTTGTSLQESGIIVDDSDNMTGVNNITAGGAVAVTGAITGGTIGGVVNVVGTTDSQTLTNKTIDADNSTITNLAHGAEVDNLSSGIHGVTGSVVGTTDSQTLTNKTIDADNSTITNLAHGAEVDNLSSGIHGVVGNVLGTTDAQVITLKDIDGGTATDTSRFTIPKDAKATLDALSRKEATIVYASDESTAYIDDGSNLIEIGGGGGAGGAEQFITGDNRNFDVATGSWATYADAAAASPVDMTGGSATLTITRTATTPLVGDGMGVITKDAADRQGEGISLSSIAIPDGFQGQPLKVRVIGEGSANYVAGDLVINTYDQTNSNLLGALQNVDNGDMPKDKTIIEGILYPASDTALLRLGFHTATVNAAAWTFNIDEVQLFWDPTVVLAGTRVQTYEIEQAGNALTNRNLEIEFNLATATIRNNGSELLVASDDSGGTRTIWTAQTDCHVGVGLGGLGDLLSTRGRVFLNGSEIMGGSSVYAANAKFAVSAHVFMAAGDVLSVATDSNITNTASVVQAQISALALGDTVNTTSINSGLSFEEKLLTATDTGTGVMSDLTFTGLRVGTRYTIGGHIVFINAISGDASFEGIVTIANGAQALGRIRLKRTVSGSTYTNFIEHVPVSYTFVAEDTSLTFDLSTNIDLDVQGSFGKNSTFITLKEEAFSQTALIARQAKAAIYDAQPTGTIAGSFGSATTVIFDTIASDDLGSYNTSTGVYTVPNGARWLKCWGQLAFSSASPLDSAAGAWIANGGVEEPNQKNWFRLGSASNPAWLPFSFMIRVSSGDLITIRAFSNDTTPTFSNAAGYHFLNFEATW